VKWRTANNRKRQKQKRAVPIFVKRNLDRWRGADWATISKAIRDERLGPQAPPFRPTRRKG